MVDDRDDDAGESDDEALEAAVESCGKRKRVAN